MNRSIWFLVALLLLPLRFYATGADSNLLRENAIQGEVEAQLQLGDEFFFGRERASNLEIAAYWFRRAAEQGSAKGCYNLAVCQEHGWGVPTSLASAYASYTKAAQLGLPEAKLRQAVLMFYGVSPEKGDWGELPGVVASPDKSIRILRELIQDNFLPARYELARLLYSDAGLRRSHGSEIRDILEKSCAVEQPPVEALLLLSNCYREGIGGGMDLRGAADCAERASKLGDPEGMACYAEFLEYGLGCSMDRQRAYELSKLSAESGSPHGLLRLGDCYLKGEFVEHDPKAAVACYRKAAERGYSPAYLRLGHAYLNGIGVDKDPVRAVEEYGKAARAGDATAQYCLGSCYLDGIGVAADPVGAVFWFKSAVGRGNLDAMRELGVCLLTGRGVKPDPVEGSRLLRAAAIAGDSKARKLVENQ